MCFEIIQRITLILLPICCQFLNKYACNPHKHWASFEKKSLQLYTAIYILCPQGLFHPLSCMVFPSIPSGPDLFRVFCRRNVDMHTSLYFIGPVVLRAINQVRKNSLNGNPKCIVTAIYAYPRRIFLPSSIILDSLVYSSSNIHRPFSVITYHFCRPS